MVISHTSLEEGTAEVAANEVVSLLQEAVGIIRVRQVGRSTDHVGHLLSQLTENGSRGATSSTAGLLFHLAPVNNGSLTAEPLLELLGLQSSSVPQHA